MKKLHIAAGFSLPLDFVTSTQAILARRRRGKSYTASVEAEEMLEAGQHVVVIDPTSAWFGLRSSADGQGPGYSIAVFGGEHADAPLDFRAGKAMARAVVDHGFSAIFDIGGWITDEQIQFVYDFASELLRLNRNALHLFLDEADTFAPQMLESKEQKKCLGAVSRLVKQGGIKGVGVTMISQRPADINKKVLSQIDTLTVLCMSHPPDIKPVAEWISTNISAAGASEIASALPRLEIGEAFLCSSLTGERTHINVRERRTFNSGATPKPGERKIAPKILAKIDLKKLGEEIEASIEKAKADDPSLLRQQINQLRTDLHKAHTAIQKPSQPDLAQLLPDPAAIAKIIDEQMEIAAQRMHKGAIAMADQIDRKSVQLGESFAVLSAHLRDYDNWKIHLSDRQSKNMVSGVRLIEISGHSQRLQPAHGGSGVRKAQSTVPRAPARPTGDSGGSGNIPKGERAVLTVLAQHGPSRRIQLSVFTGFARSTRDAYLQRLAAKGFIDAADDLISLTEDGISALGSWEALPTGVELQRWWLANLPKGEATILELICASGPEAIMSREDISEATGFARSTRDAYIQRLSQKLLLVSDSTGVKASETLFN